MTAGAGGLGRGGRRAVLAVAALSGSRFIGIGGGSGQGGRCAATGGEEGRGWLRVIRPRTSWGGRSRGRGLVCGWLGGAALGEEAEESLGRGRELLVLRWGGLPLGLGLGRGGALVGGLEADGLEDLGLALLLLREVERVGRGEVGGRRVRRHHPAGAVRSRLGLGKGLGWGHAVVRLSARYEGHEGRGLASWVGSWGSGLGGRAEVELVGRVLADSSQRPGGRVFAVGARGLDRGGLRGAAVALPVAQRRQRKCVRLAQPREDAGPSSRGRLFLVLLLGLIQRRRLGVAGGRRPHEAEAEDALLAAQQAVVVLGLVFVLVCTATAVRGGLAGGQGVLVGEGGRLGVGDGGVGEGEVGEGRGAVARVADLPREGRGGRLLLLRAARRRPRVIGAALLLGEGGGARRWAVVVVLGALVGRQSSSRRQDGGAGAGLGLGGGQGAGGDRGQLGDGHERVVAASSARVAREVGRGLAVEVGRQLLLVQQRLVGLAVGLGDGLWHGLGGGRGGVLDLLHGVLVEVVVRRGLPLLVQTRLAASGGGRGLGQVGGQVVVVGRPLAVRVVSLGLGEQRLGGLEEVGPGDESLLRRCNESRVS